MNRSVYSAIADILLQLVRIVVVTVRFITKRNNYARNVTNSYFQLARNAKVKCHLVTVMFALIVQDEVYCSI